ncbi:mitochondrial ribosomal death-associated protein 3-domain-containing protein [Mortierella sp. GBAus27b]|nr:37S ribosomal protein S23 mitochondrial [Mortierella sp. GBA43]KAI8346815.1 mitochondrial ribosomal death-associated protein 3-domain-containing protein [Mortierella sp. GBAus27b]
MAVKGAKAKGAAAGRAKGQSNSFRKKKAADEDSSEGAMAGGSRLNDKYYKPVTPVKVEEFLPSAATKENVGRVLGFPSNVAPALDRTGYPTLLNEQFDLINPAALVVREPTVSLLEKIDKAMTTPSAQSRIVLTGEPGSGKSAMLLQTVSHCLSAGWVVIYVPKASTWMNSTFAYNKAANTTTFVQPLLASNLAGQINSVNKPTLSKIVTSEIVKVGRQGAEVAKGTTLTDLLEIGVRDTSAAQDVMEVFMKEMSAQNEIPTLIAVDELNSFFRPTQYLNQDGKELDPEFLKLPKLFLDYISGKSTTKHGAVVAAMSDSFLENKSDVLDIALGLKQVSPYFQQPQNVVSWTQGLTRFDVPTYTRTEAKGVFDYYKKGNIFFDAASESLFLNKFITSGGNPRKFFTACAKGI